MRFKKANISKCSSLSPQRFGFKISLPKLNSLSTTALDGRVVLYWNCKLALIASTRTAVAYSALNPPNGTITRKRSWKTITAFTLTSNHTYSPVNTVKKIWIKGYGWSDMRLCVLCCQCNTIILNGIHKKSVICFKAWSTKSNCSCNFF